MMFEKETQDPQNSNTIIKRCAGGICEMSASKSEDRLRRYKILMFLGGFVNSTIFKDTNEIHCMFAPSLIYLHLNKFFHALMSVCRLLICDFACLESVSPRGQKLENSLAILVAGAPFCFIMYLFQKQRMIIIFNDRTT